MIINDKKIKSLKTLYRNGMKVKLIKMQDDYTSLKEGAEGTIDFVDDIGTIFVNWDNGSTLGLIVGEDEFKTFQVYSEIKEIMKNGEKNEEVSEMQ